MADLAALPDMPSQPSLRQFIRSRPDFPIVQRGERGTAYVFDLAAAAAFVRRHWADGRSIDQRRNKRRERITPLPLFSEYPA